MRFLAVIVLILGIVFFIASADIGQSGNMIPRMIIGAVLCGVGVFLYVHSGRKGHGDASQDAPAQRIEFSGDVKLQEITCSKCGGALSSKDVAVKAGAVFITCPYCKSEYQVEEAPKW